MPHTECGGRRHAIAVGYESICVCVPLHGDGGGGPSNSHGRVSANVCVCGPCDGEHPMERGPN
jgi:hypothetical protein